MLQSQAVTHQTADIDGVQLFYREAGRPDAPGLLLLHGQPCSSFYFRHVLEPLGEIAHVVAPDLPGFGFTEAPEDYTYTFDAMAETIAVLLERVGMRKVFLYVHDFGAPVAYRLAMTHPERVLGLIIQNGNAHDSGLGPDWEPNKRYWADPSPENRDKLVPWLDYDGVKRTYVSGIPERLVPRFAPDGWTLDWERMNQPGRVDIQFRIFEDYGHYIERYGAIADYHRTEQPRALLLWGRHDPYFELAEVMDYARELERLELHIFDGTHLLLETHHRECTELMLRFVTEVLSESTSGV